MKISTKLALAGALFAAGVAPMGAGAATAKTNYDLTIGFNLTSYVAIYAAGITPVTTLATRDVINGLSGTPYTNVTPVYTATNGAGATSNFTAPPPAGWTTVSTASTNVPQKLPTFSTTAKMVFRQVVDGSNVTSRGVFILDGKGTNATTTEVSPWVTNGASASALLTNGAQTTTRSFETFAVLEGAPAFIVTGLATKTTGPTGETGATLLRSLSAEIGGNGAAIFGTTTFTSVISGTITFSGGRFE
jgi:hypothetical protein